MSADEITPEKTVELSQALFDQVSLLCAGQNRLVVANFATDFFIVSLLQVTLGDVKAAKEAFDILIPEMKIRFSENRDAVIEALMGINAPVSIS